MQTLLGLYMASERTMEEWIERYEDMSRKELILLLVHKTQMIQHLLQGEE